MTAPMSQTAWVAAGCPFLCGQCGGVVDGGGHYAYQGVAHGRITCPALWDAAAPRRQLVDFDLVCCACAAALADCTGFCEAL